MKEEIEKRLEAERELSRTKELLSRTKGDELNARSKLQALEGQHSVLNETCSLLKSDLQDIKKSLENEKRYVKNILEEKSQLEVEYHRMRREYETNDIIVMGLREQLRVIAAQNTPFLAVCNPRTCAKYTPHGFSGKESAELVITNF